MTNGKGLDMNKLVLSVSMALSLVYGARAYEVLCNMGTHNSGLITTDTVEYKVTVGDADDEMSSFTAGYFVAPTAGSLYVKDSGGFTIGSWSQATDVSNTTGNKTFAADGSVITPNAFVSELKWSGTALAIGTYYFGYKVAADTYALGERIRRNVKKLPFENWY